MTEATNARRLEAAVRALAGARDELRRAGMSDEAETVAALLAELSCDLDTATALSESRARDLETLREIRGEAAHPETARAFLVTATWLEFLDDGDTEVFEVEAEDEESARREAEPRIDEMSASRGCLPSLVCVEERLADPGEEKHD